MTPEQLRQLLETALASGCGVLISAFYGWWLGTQNPEPTPMTKRLAVFALCVLVPTALYLTGVVFSWWGYDPATNLADVLAAFATSQLWHAQELSNKESGLK